MDFFGDIFGNERQKSFFEALIREGKLSHAYILEAPTGGGKKMFALRTAAVLAAADDVLEERDKKCRRILEGLSPDVRILSRGEDGKKTIGVDAVRDFTASVYLAPSELGFQFYIFDEADRITPQAQNALLKIVEEPPRNVYLFLLCENALSLLTTVRSRAQKVSLQVFDESALADYARRVKLSGADDAAKLGFAVRMANGAIGRLRTILENGESEFAAYSAAKQAVEGQAMKGRGISYYEFLKRICDFVQTREALEALTGYLLSAYGDIARARCTEEAPPVFFSEDEVRRYAMTFDTGSIVKSFDAVNSVKGDLRFNPNLSLAAAVLAMALWKAV